MSNILVAYFSASGVTKKVAQSIAQAINKKGINADLHEIIPEAIYSANDLNWHNEKSRSSVEMKDPNSRPKIANSIDVNPYDVIVLGFPIWWYVAPRIIQTFLESGDFSTKKVVLFATSGGSGMGETQKVLEKTCKASFKNGGILGGWISENDIEKWLKSLNIGI
ncbi:hypothetical protein CCY99_03745 [Helicobacter sp. 16-1353]|uniref:flavodoxin n=1 Tax=Helicobacter sp. 16-1353 TaxID=2004996 RepID=UPI000DCF5225|nr:flavodoxin [Helicobacter sp. 16-1353]RAX54473.1 hypothetical protein CCY99_03745 [Helicobacter sp. 16-1353]